MTDLAQQFGQALNRSRALRSAIGLDPTTTNYATTTEPHERGSILVAAVFSAFFKIYQRRTADLLRIATGGSGVLQPGHIHPDLVERLAREATKAAVFDRSRASHFGCHRPWCNVVAGARWQ